MRRSASPPEDGSTSRSDVDNATNGPTNRRRGRGWASTLPARLRGFFADLGPGLTTGAADDDPSGISTYSVTGASFGYGPLWTALFSFPLMVSVRLMCARLGMVTGLGLAGIVRRRYPRGVLWGACALLVVANTFNIGADLGGMAEATEMVTGIDSRMLVMVYAVLIVSLLFWSSYRRIARIFKWLTLVLFAYVGAAFSRAPIGARSCARPSCRRSSGRPATSRPSSAFSAPRSRRTSSSGRRDRRWKKSARGASAPYKRARERPTRRSGARTST
jgi:hypothetical protein